MSSKRCCVLAVVCLSVILLSLDADAQQTVHDDSSQCGSASLQQVVDMMRVIASNLQEIKDSIQENVVEMRKLVKPTDCSTCPSVTTTTSPPEHSTLEPAKQQRVSALVCEYAV